MVSDSIINASIPNDSKDIGKKKRANRSAKLKQHKLHTRREQWLSQGQVRNKGCNKEEVNGAGGGGEFRGPMIETRNKKSCYKELEVRSPSVEEIHHDSDSELSPGNSPTSSMSGGNYSGNNYTGSGSSISSSSFSSVGCCSGSITEEEECGGVGDDGCLDDWEAVADALAAQDADDKHNHNPGAESYPKKETVVGSDSTAQVTGHGNVDAEESKPKLDGAGILGRAVVSCKAWRADDAFRPQSLPNLSKQRSFPANSERKFCRGINPWIRNNLPTSCPICCEDLDVTDTSFLPCSCGFRLCLFCHKRILEEDGRCPGCRKPYAADPVEKETTVSGASLTIRLARSCSMFSRV